MRFDLRYLRPIGLGALACIAVAGCDTFDQKKKEVIDPNVFPTDYKSKIAVFMKTYLTDRTSYLGAAISSPVLKAFGADNRYVVCVRLVSGSQAGEKIAVFFGGQLNQLVEASPGSCAGAQYEPFRELEQVR